MKLFFISDIHGSLACLKRALAKFDESGADQLIILGDELYHGPRNPIPEAYNSAECAELLNTYKEKIIAIRGNCDSEVDQMILEYPIMDTSSSLVVDGIRFYFSHGHIYNPKHLPPLNSGDVFCFGHIHLPIAEKQGEITVLNPGSITLPKGGNPPSYAVYESHKLQVLSFSGEVIAETTT